MTPFDRHPTHYAIDFDPMPIEMTIGQIIEVHLGWCGRLGRLRRADRGIDHDRRKSAWGILPSQHNPIAGKHVRLAEVDADRPSHVLNESLMRFRVGVSYDSVEAHRDMPGSVFFPQLE